MDEIFNLLSSSARIDKSKRKKNLTTSTNHSLTELKQSPSTTKPKNDNSDNNDNNNDNDDNNVNNPKKHSPAKELLIHQETIAHFRNKMRIVLSKDNKHDTSIPDPISSFEDIIPPKWWNINHTKSNTTTTNNNNSSELNVFKSLTHSIIRNVECGRWVHPTPIQMQAIPSILARRDVLGCAPTGSGKSGAFIIPTLFLSTASDGNFYNTQPQNSDTTSQSKQQQQQQQKRNKHPKQEKILTISKKRKIHAVLIAPSRELATQLHREVERLGEGKIRGLKCALLSKSNLATLCNPNSSNGGTNGSHTSKPIDVLVSTPLRLAEHVDQLELSAVRIIVLDEADRLLDASDGQQQLHQQDQHQSGSMHTKTFLSQMDVILSNIPTTAVRALFSATIGASVRQLADSILRNPVDITIGSNSGNSTLSGVNHNISQSLQFVGKEEGKLLAIRQIISRGITPPVIIFLQSKERAQALYMELMYDNIHVDVIHAGKSQAARDAAVARFRKGDTWILICTDLCARGLDFKAVNMVINYDLPTSGVTYVHRIGRCGRAGRKGEAISLFTEADFEHLSKIANIVKLSGCDVPDWMLSIKKNRGLASGAGGGRSLTNGRKSIPMKRKTIDTTAGYDKAKMNRRKKAIDNNKRAKMNKNDNGIDD
jgi:ATP-dependent RNA helicase DDX52/ROK1